MGKGHELVMGIEVDQLFDKPSGFYFSGFMLHDALVEGYMEKINKKATFRHRGECETDPTFKQIIPYCIITRGQDIFTYKRKTGGDEIRLHAKASLGVGGHVNPIAASPSPQDEIDASMLRELDEEVEFISGTEIPTPQFIGMLNWDNDAVGKVHLGLVYHLRLPSHIDVQVKEKDKMEGQFEPISQLMFSGTKWETWSLLLITDLLTEPTQEARQCLSR